MSFCYAGILNEGKIIVHRFAFRDDRTTWINLSRAQGSLVIGMEANTTLVRRLRDLNVWRSLESHHSCHPKSLDYVESVNSESARLTAKERFEVVSQIPKHPAFEACEDWEDYAGERLRMLEVALDRAILILDDCVKTSRYSKAVSLLEYLTKVKKEIKV